MIENDAKRDKSRDGTIHRKLWQRTLLIPVHHGGVTGTGCLCTVQTALTCSREEVI